MSSFNKNYTYLAMTKCMATPSNMEVFLHTVYGPSLHERAKAPAVMEAYDLLLTADMIRIRSQEEKDQSPTITNPFTLTKKGNYYLKFILSVPFPVEQTTFIITPPEID